MAIRKRLIIAGIISALSVILYGAGLHYSPALIQYVVEQSLIQKAPAGTDPVELHKRLHALVSAIPDQNTRMKMLLRISEYIEKIQRLSLKDMDRLLAPERAWSRESLTEPALFSFNWNFCPGNDVLLNRTCSRPGPLLG
ncbi:MAG TPA: hypothetical protein VMG30_18025 [Acidobacteriota bacterium]|nr:hypothetical protein [Acidobacteriota bacterium]